MKGAIVFLVVFAIFTVVTIAAYPTLPPGPQIYQALNVPAVDYPVVGVPATLLVIAVFNGVVYGVIAWLAYTIVVWATKKGKTKPPAAAPQQAQPSTPGQT